MYTWGVILMITGGLSFILPVFGRQFLVVSALGLTGTGPTAIGLVLFVVGLCLFAAANSSGARSPRPGIRAPQWPPKTAPALVPMNPKIGAVKSSTATATAAPTPPATPTGGRFALGDSDYTDPYLLGIGLVPSSLESSRRIVEGMIGAAELPSQQAIRNHIAPVQLHALALISAVYYVCANKASSADKHALTRLATGLVDGFAAVFDFEPGGEAARRNALSIYGLVQDYAQSLSDELDSLDPNTLGDNPFDMGPTARLVVHNIAGQCGIQEALSVAHLQRMTLETIARDCGSLALMKLLASKRMTYSSS